jgi:UrcA family protein
MSLFRNLAWPVVATVAVLVASAPASAQQQIVITGKKIPPHYEPVTRTVNIADLNLATNAGVEEMHKRVANAIGKVCPTPGGITITYAQRDAAVCRDFAWTGARQQMDRAVHSATERAPKQMH